MNSAPIAPEPPESPVVDPATPKLPGAGSVPAAGKTPGGKTPGGKIPGGKTPGGTLGAGGKTTARKGVPWRKILAWIAAILILALLAFWVWQKLHPDTTTKMVTAVVARGDLIETISATGSVEAQTGAEVHVGSQVSGQIKLLTTDVGHKVKAGQLIVQLNLPELLAQLNEAKAALAVDETLYAQQVSGVNQEITQTAGAIQVAKQGLLSTQQLLAVAVANARQQHVQTPTDIRKARAALITARSSLVQTQAGANLQISVAQEASSQAQANARNSAANLNRVTRLYLQGFSAAADVDTAKATDGVYQSEVRSANHNILLVQQQVTASLQAAKDAVGSAEAALLAADSERQTAAARDADVKNAATALRQAQANLLVAQGNEANDVLKQQQVKAALETVSQAKSLVAYDQSEYAHAFIRSPISGTVLSLAAQQGETVSAGLATQTVVLVADLNRLEIDAFVDETDIGKVALHQIATCTLDAYPGMTFKGKVAKIASGSTIQQAVVTYDVTIGIEDPKHLLKPDMTSNIDIQTGYVHNAIIVPASVVQISGKGSTVNTVRVVNGKQVMVATPVTTGGTDGVNVQILSGLTVGETIVISGGTAAASHATSAFATPASHGGGGGGRG